MKQQYKVTIICAAITAAATVIGAIVTGGFGLVKPTGLLSQQNSLGKSNTTIQSSVLIGNVASNMDSSSKKIKIENSVTAAESNKASEINQVVGQGVSVSKSTNVNVITVHDIKVDSGGVGINQGTINNSGEKK